MEINVADKSLLTLPCNRSMYSKIRKNNSAYVDKTMFIELLEKNQIDYPFIIRPRRFGKTLFVNTLNWADPIRSN